ncbi:Bug family tripartite tricarboxylate transporter substrate binding protein [Ottowia thiooxydans]|uniref:Bug family tripartite tricarboxylate transporter substrate binding protein n=1 Tax=Ottowia thiooxydans TaxID=219182 RepID=UPI000425C962|nr:tripartite tricarboxylate transporter substrate binding protein [Ottowia thiooxydans]
MNLLARVFLTLGVAMTGFTAVADESPIRVILPFAAGSGTDNIARPLLDEVTKATKQVFVIDNRPGASGAIAAQAVAQAAPDGRTFMVTTNTTHTINPVLFKKLPYDPVKDFSPVAMVSTSPYLLMVRKDMPVSNVKELMDWIKLNPGKASYGWGAAVSQMAGAGFLKRFDLNAIGVPYKSSPQAVTDLIGGQISFMFLDLPAAVPHLKGDRLKPLLVTAPKRLAQLPSVPTASEAGIKDFDVSAWIGVFAPAGTPAPAIKKMTEALTQAMRSPALLERFESCCVPEVLVGDAFTTYLQKDSARWVERAAAAGIQPE